MKNGRYSDARDSFETVLIFRSLQPDGNPLPFRINDELKKIADERREQIFRERLAEVRWKWAEPVTPLLAGPSGDLGSKAIRKGAEVTSLQNKLDNIIFPEIKIHDEPLIDVLNKLRQKSEQYHTDANEGVNFVIQLKRISAAQAAVAMPVLQLAAKGCQRWATWAFLAVACLQVMAWAWEVVWMAAAWAMGMGAPGMPGGMGMGMEGGMGMGMDSSHWAWGWAWKAAWAWAVRLSHPDARKTIPTSLSTWILPTSRSQRFCSTSFLPLASR